jgi:hypothetical protein
MTREDLVLSIAVANFILTWGVALYMYLANKNKATNERINTLETDVEAKIERHTEAENKKFEGITVALGDNSQRIQHLETTAEMAPTHHDLAKVYESQNKSDEKLNKLIGENETQSAILRTILTQITQKGLA